MNYLKFVRCADGRRVKRTDYDAYHGLQNSVSVASLSFERACEQLRKLLSDGSWEECGEDFRGVSEFPE